MGNPRNGRSEIARGSGTGLESGRAPTTDGLYVIIAIRRGTLPGIAGNKDARNDRQLSLIIHRLKKTKFVAKGREVRSYSVRPYCASHLSPWLDYEESELFER